MGMGQVTEGSVERVPVLRDFTFIGDGERGALIGPDGDIVWMCAPRWHDDAIFASLIGGRGRYSITPVGRYTSGGQLRGRHLDLAQPMGRRARHHRK